MIAIVVILVADLLLILKRPHVPSMKEAGLWVGFYILLALCFAGLLFLLGDAQHGTEFLAGWVTEYSLSIDNLFVFVIIMSRFKVPRQFQQEVLMVGIIIALICRGIFIVAGAAIINQFAWVFYIFGAFLLWTAYKQAFGDEDDEGEDNGLIKLLKKRGNVTSEYHENKLTTMIDGKKFMTPMLLVFVAIGTTDVMFALDSIPAIFGITQSPYLVFTANVFALMGLRQLYFLLGGLLDRLEYLKYGIAAILGFIGVKLVFHALHENNLPFLNGGEPIHAVPEITTVFSLVFIVLAMGVATIASLIKMRRSPDRVTFGEVTHEEHEDSGEKNS